ncbi:MAG: c-type cytochrome, partial [Gemmatimonadales bacterium]
MILNRATQFILLFTATVTTPGAALLTAPSQQDPVNAPIVRRLAAMTRLAAQEYDLGIEDGRVVLAAEVEEAALFLSEAQRTAALLPRELSILTVARLDTLRSMVARSAPPDSVSARVAVLSRTLSEELGIPLEQIPSRTPKLARGGEVYQANCASCHGTLGRGDGPAGVGLDPPPADLTDAAALADASPLDYYQRITIGVAGTAMPAFETQLSEEDRWAAALYASLLRLPAPRGDVPPALRSFSTTGRMSDLEIAEAVGGHSDSALAMVAAVRSARTQPDDAEEMAGIFDRVRAQLDSAFALARAGEGELASSAAFDAYMTFEQVERDVRAQDQGLVTSLEAGFAAFRTRAAGGATPGELRAIHLDLAADLEKAERTIGEPLSDFNLLSQSFVIMLREGLEAILIIG